MDETYVQLTRRDALRTGAAAGLGTAIAGCASSGDGGGDDTLLTEGFEDGLDDWETAAHIGPEEPLSAFEWSIERSQDQAAAGEWSLEVFTEGDHDDGTAWAVTERSGPGDVTGFDVSFSAWSESESFNTLRNVVAYLGPAEPTEEGDFPDPGMNTSTVTGAPYGGLREPLHLTDGWHEYSFSWEPEEVPETLYFAVGVTVVWEAGATHYVDSISVEEQ